MPHNIITLFTNAGYNLNDSSLEAINFIKFLVKKKGIDVNFQDSTSNTALHIFAHCNYSACRVLLEELGADCNIRNKQGETALMIALQKRQINIAKYILSLPEVNINFEDVTGFTAFIYAANQTGFMRLFNFTAAQKVIAADPHKKESLYNPYTEKESLKIAHKLFVDSLAPDLKFKVTISIPGREEEMPIGCILLRVCLEYDNKEFAQTLVAAGVDTEPLSVDNTCLEYIMTNKEIPLYKHHNFDKKWEYRHNSWEATRQRIIDRTKLKLEQAKTTPEAGSVEQPIVDNEVTRNR